MPENRSEQIIWHGHRGCRGLRPENSLPAFIKAMELGMDALEMDVVISKDLQVVVAHEPFMPYDICERPDGSSISEEESKGINLFRMEYDEIRQYNCGLKHPRFPEQVAEPVHRPLLSELFTEIEARWKLTDEKAILYTIELKSASDLDGLYHPPPAEFVKLVLDVIRDAETLDRCILQSFDQRVLREIRSQSPKAKISLLLDKEIHLDESLKSLGFEPEFLGPHFELVDQGLIEACHAKSIKVVPWTVNEVSDMKRLIALGVDGLITDHPDRKQAVRG